MQSFDNSRAFESNSGSIAFPGRWLARRLALWVAIMTIGITGSCLLYKLVSTAEADASISDTAIAKLPHF